MAAVASAPAAGPGPVVVTARLVLRPFEDADRAPFFALNTHHDVAASFGSAPSRAESDAMVDHIEVEMARDGWGLWAVEVAGGPPFAGMVGLHRVRPQLPFAPAVEVEWRLHPEFWGRGYATEAAAASLRFGFEQVGLAEIVAFTTTLNSRSQAVMARIGMRHDAERDFDHPLVPDGSPLRRHVLYRVTRTEWADAGSHAPRTVTP